MIPAALSSSSPQPLCPASRFRHSSSIHFMPRHSPPTSTVFRFGCLGLSQSLPFTGNHKLSSCAPKLIARHCVHFRSSFRQPLGSPPAASSCSPATLTRLRACQGFCPQQCLSILLAITQAALLNLKQKHLPATACKHSSPPPSCFRLLWRARHSYSQRLALKRLQTTSFIASALALLS